MIIVRYLVKETFASQISIFVILFLIFLSQQLISILGEASDGNIPAQLIFHITALNMPGMMTLILPLSIYIGILLTYGRLYSEQEITVMNATGMGSMLLLRASMMMGMAGTLLAMVNVLWLSPWAKQQERQVLYEYSKQANFDLVKSKQFQQTPDGSAILFVESSKNGNLEDIFLVQLDSNKNGILPSVLLAESGAMTLEADGSKRLKLNDGSRYQGVPTQLNYLNTEFDYYEADVGELKGRLKGLETESLEFRQLIQQSKQENEMGLEAQVELQWRFSMILAIPMLTLLVIPLTKVSPRQGRFAKMGPAILLFVAYFLAINGMKSQLVKGSIPIEFGLWPVHGVLLLFITWLYFRERFR